MQSFGVNVIATHLGAKETISVVNMSIPIAIIMGSEDKGLGPHIMRLVDTQVIIPQANDFDSLNVSIATGIILYEVVRQRALQQRIFK
tara:strand:- start:580 stop:843 length:264 start_codon:yes stop_codon:yes gene_type:complete